MNLGKLPDAEELLSALEIVARILEKDAQEKEVIVQNPGRICKG